MKLAVLGTDVDILALARAALTAGHSVAWLGDVRAKDRPVLRQLLPKLDESADWESLLDHALVDAVLVGRGTARDDLRAEQIKRLVADVMPVLVVHPLGTSVLVYYELDMARHEVHGVLRHYAPLAGAPSVAQLAEWVQAASGPMGDVHQVRCDRYLADCRRDNVVRHLARDVEVLRQLAGTIRSVSAVGPRTTDASYASLQVQMTGPAAATLRWAVVPAASSDSRAELTIVGERGTATWRLESDEELLTLAIAGAQETIPLPPFDAPRAAIDALAKSFPAGGAEGSDAASTWQSATAAMEVVDTIELSLQKSRTIEVHQQRLTEQVAFRGTMAAFGCGLLTLIFVGLIAAGVVGDVLGVPLKDYWPAALLALLALFLAMQGLPLIVKRRQRLGETTDERES